MTNLDIPDHWAAAEKALAKAHSSSMDHAAVQAYSLLAIGHALVATAMGLEWHGNRVADAVETTK